MQTKRAVRKANVVKRLPGGPARKEGWTAFAISILLALMVGGCADETCADAPPALLFTINATNPGAVRSLEVTVVVGEDRFRRVYDLESQLLDGTTSISVRVDPAPTSSFGADVSVRAFDQIGAAGTLLSSADSLVTATPDACNHLTLDLESKAVDGGVDAGGIDATPEDATLDAGISDNGFIDATDAGDHEDAETSEGGTNDATVPECGNGLLEGEETCDDDNTIGMDGCSSTCEVESGYDCNGQPSSCTTARAPNTYKIEQLSPQTTTSNTFVDVPGAELVFTPPSVGPWMVFVSGRLGSSSDDDNAARMLLTINGVEADRWGHALRGGSDNEAGFLTFHRIESISQQTIKLQFMALVGTTTVDSIRIVVARIPPNADFQFIEDAAEEDLTGSDFSILDLDFTPDSPGDYYVLAKATQSTFPNAGGVQGWLQHGTTVRPDAPSGVRYSNATRSSQPYFVALKTTLQQTEQTFSLRGASGSNISVLDWWNLHYPTRTNFSVMTGAEGINAGYSVRYTFDHAALVQAGKSRADGDDLRVVHADAIELPRVLDDNSSWNSATTTIWFPAATAISASTPDTAYAIYYGSANASNPPSDPASIFLFHDDFEGSAVDPQNWDLLAGSPSVSGGALVLATNDRVMMVPSHAFGTNTALEASGRVLTGSAPTLTFLAACDATACNDATSFVLGAADFTLRTVVGGTETGADPYTPVTLAAWHHYTILRESNVRVRYFADTLQIAQHTTVPNTDLRATMENASDHTAEYQWIRVRDHVDPEPLTLSGTESSLAGSHSSRFSNRRIMTFRADAFTEDYYDESTGPSTTSAGALTEKNVIELPQVPIVADRLILQSARISSTNPGGNVRRSGIFQIGTHTLLETGHKIDRGSTRFGYHHTAGVVDVRFSQAAQTYRNGFASPDGAEVVCAESVIIVLQY